MIEHGNKLKLKYMFMYTRNFQNKRSILIFHAITFKPLLLNFTPSIEPSISRLIIACRFLIVVKRSIFPDVTRSQIINDPSSLETEKLREEIKFSVNDKRSDIYIYKKVSDG